jgi:hypothetical protein
VGDNTTIKHDNSSSESDKEEEETDPVKIEKKKLITELEKYQNYGYNETHNEIMSYLEVDDPSKYKPRAKGVKHCPFFMIGKYGKSNRFESQLQEAQHEKEEKEKEERELKELKDKEEETLEIKKRKLIVKKKLEQIRQQKVKSRNLGMPNDGKGVYNTMSPELVKHKFSLKDLFNKNAQTKVPEKRVTQKVTLDMLQHMNLKEYNINQTDEFKPREVLGDDGYLDDDGSVFNYFFPESKKLKGKKTTTNKFNIKKARIKSPIIIKEEDATTNYYSEKEKKLDPPKKVSKLNVGNSTSRASAKETKGSNSTRRSMNKGALTNRKSGKTLGLGKSKSKSKSKTQSSSNMLRKQSSQKSKMLARAAQIDKQVKSKEKNTLNRVLKMHDNKLKNSMNVLKKK